MLNQQPEQDITGIITEVKKRIDAILSEYGCVLMPTTIIQGNQFIHRIDIMIKSKSSDLVDPTGQQL